MHFIYFNNLYRFLRTDISSSFTKCFNPIVDSDMAALKDPAYGAEAKTFQIKLKRLSLDCRAFSNMLYCMSIPASFALIALSSFDNAIFFAISATTFRTDTHGNSS